MTANERRQIRQTYFAAMQLWAESNPGETVPAWSCGDWASWMRITKERKELESSTQQQADVARKTRRL